MKKEFLLSIISFALYIGSLGAKNLYVGAVYPYASIKDAAVDAFAGDSILIHAGTYDGDQYISNLQGTITDWIYIGAYNSEIVTLHGGQECLKMSNIKYIQLDGIIFENSATNIVNIDDGGTPNATEHILITNCTFQNGNADYGTSNPLKISGINYFEIRNCTIYNNLASSGSGIDMVGCHHGLVTKSRFEKMGHNSIQMKGGTQDIKIIGNFFKDGGSRSLNIGGSTGAQYFRPLNASYEASDIKVYSNIFVGSEASIAFVGAVNCEVVNNTMYKPTNFALRILQENNSDGIQQCASNTFRNNIIYIVTRVASYAINVGDNTKPETFTFSNNLWFDVDNTKWGGPNWPVAETNYILNKDPLFNDAGNSDFSISQYSPASGKAFNVENPINDYEDKAFNNPRCIGAFERVPLLTLIVIEKNMDAILLYPNPVSFPATLKIKGLTDEDKYVEIIFYNIWGDEVSRIESNPGFEINVPLTKGIYLYKVLSSKGARQASIVIN